MDFVLRDRVSAYSFVDVGKRKHYVAESTVSTAPATAGA